MDVDEEMLRADADLPKTTLLMMQCNQGSK